MKLVALNTQTYTTCSTLMTLRQAIENIEREIAQEPPFSRANAERRGELDQLRDMIDRRT